MGREFGYKRAQSVTIDVAIVEDDPPARKILASWIERAEGFHCVSEHGDAESALVALPQERPQVVLMDINLPWHHRRDRQHLYPADLREAACEFAGAGSGKNAPEVVSPKNAGRGFNRKERREHKEETRGPLIQSRPQMDTEERKTEAFYRRWTQMNADKKQRRRWRPELQFVLHFGCELSASICVHLR